MKKLKTYGEYLNEGFLNTIVDFLKDLNKMSTPEKTKKTKTIESDIEHRLKQIDKRVRNLQDQANDKDIETRKKWSIEDEIDELEQLKRKLTTELKDVQKKSKGNKMIQRRIQRIEKEIQKLQDKKRDLSPPQSWRVEERIDKLKEEIQELENN